MRHFGFLSDSERASLFSQAPETFDVTADRHDIGVGLGGMLYTPATRVGVAQSLLAGRWAGLTAQVLCLEDAVADHEVVAGERQLATELRVLADAIERGEGRREDLPLLFVRPRSPRHAVSVLNGLGELADLLAGFVLPKFSSLNAAAYLEAVAERATSRPFWALPVLEGPQVVHRETRDGELQALTQVLYEFRDHVACVRIGATDLSGLYGIRRSPDVTIYDVGVVRDCIVDIVNVLGRPGTGHVISGPVWEYFRPEQRVLKPQLRESPFSNEGGSEGLALRRRLVEHGVDGLVRELLLDRANGLEGKTVIHPSHVVAVNALGAVTLEEHLDACTILERSRHGGGAGGSAFSNKMNEANPHREWARRVLRRARLFGVLAEEHSYVALLEASVRDRGFAVP